MKKGKLSKIAAIAMAFTMAAVSYQDVAAASRRRQRIQPQIRQRKVLKDRQREHKRQRTASILMWHFSGLPQI